MEITIRSRNDLSIEILVREVPLPIVNAIRRYALAKVPSMAIDEVMIVVNTSALFDEILAHRLAMIPLYSEIALEKYREPGPDVCAKCSAELPEERPPPEICEKCYVHLSLEVEADNREVVVYSGDIKSRDPDVYPVYKNIPIVILGPGQKISLEMKARLGRGLEHAKFSPATVAVSRYVVDVVVDRKRCDLCKKCVEVCPRKLLYVEGDEVKIRDPLECIACKQCVYACDKRAIDVVPREGEYILYIESSGVMRPEMIVREAINILISELDDLSKKVVEWREKRGQT